MKTVILSILILTFFGLTNERTNNTDEFECSIISTKSTYDIGETPEITVAIKNNSEKDVYLIGSLDASESQWRSPYCYFTIDKPKSDSLPIVVRCGYMNSLRKEDFILVKSGEEFNPYQPIDDYGFFDSYEIVRKENFQNPGKYKITFHYSTESTALDDYLGDGKENTELRELFEKMPNIKLTSNSIEIEIKK